MHRISLFVCMTMIIPRECHIIYTTRCYKLVLKQKVYFEIFIFKYEKYRSVIASESCKKLKICNLLHKTLKLPSVVFLSFNWIVILPLEMEVTQYQFPEMQCMTSSITTMMTFIICTMDWIITHNRSTWHTIITLMGTGRFIFCRHD